MNARPPLLSAAVLFVAVVHAQAQASAPPAAAPAPPAAADESLPPGEEQAKAALEKSPRHGEWASRDDVVGLVRGLTPEEVDARLDATRAFALRIPAASGKVATIGFCWGGGRSFGYATHQPALGAAVVYYGSGPEVASLAAVRAPVLGLYGGDDARVNATIEPVAAEMKQLGRVYETEIYDGAGHGFLRAQSGPEGANLGATRKAWPRTLAFLRKHLE